MEVFPTGVNSTREQCLVTVFFGVLPTAVSMHIYSIGKTVTSFDLSKRKWLSLLKGHTSFEVFDGES